MQLARPILTRRSVRSIVGSLPLMALIASCGRPPPPPSFPDETFAVSYDGTPIRFEVMGVGRPTLVFVHGWACDRSYWRKQLEFFSERGTVVTLDLAGHGQSGLDRDPWSMEAFGNDVAAVIEKLDLEGAILVGHSMGGTVILEAALRLPKRVAALVPVDTFFNVEQRLSPEQAEQFLAPFRIDFPATARSYLQGTMFVPGTDPALREAIVTDMSQAPPDIALGALKALLTYDTPASLQYIDKPIHCINSDRYETQVEVARRYAASFDVVLVRGAGHFLMMENPEEFNRVLFEIVTELARTKNEIREEPRYDRGAERHRARAGAAPRPGPAHDTTPGETPDSVERSHG